MKKVLSILLMVCVMALSLFSFTGCNLYHDNNKRVNAEVVATVGDETITRNDINTWFNYYYYSCSMYYQYTEDDVYELTLNNLIKFKIIINEAKHTDGIVLTVSDQNHIWEQVFDYINQTLDTYEEEIRKRYGVAVEEVTTEEEETDPVVFKEYERAEITYAIDYDQNDTVLKNVFEEPKIDDNYYRYLAYQKYRAEITKTANLYSSKKMTTEEAWAEELNRYYKYYEDRAYVQKYNDYCLKNLTISDEEIVKRYINDLNTQLQDFTVYDSYLSTLTNSSNTELVVYNQLDGCFSVQQIVLEFDDMIATTHNDSSIKVSEFLSRYLNSGFVFDASEATTDEQKAYIEARDDYAYNNPDSLNMTFIDPDTGLTTNEDGEEIVKTYADFTNELNQVVIDYSDAISKIQTDYTPGVDDEIIAQKTIEAEREFVQAFYKLKFSYSKDSGVTNLDTLFNKVGYIFPENREDMTTSWVSEFTDAAYKLYDTYKETGTFAVETFVSNYGIHVMIFAGELESGAVAEKNIESLNSTYVSYATDQTIADYYYDQILSSMQSGNQNNDSSYYLQAMLGSNISSVLYEKVGSILYNEYLVAGKVDVKYPKYEDII